MVQLCVSYVVRSCVDYTLMRDESLFLTNLILVIVSTCMNHCEEISQTRPPSSDVSFSHSQTEEALSPRYFPRHVEKQQ
jgi:hypothetical protein